jgi:hypothetical protein
MTAREHGGGSCHLERRERSLFPASHEISPFGRNDRWAVPLTPLIPCSSPVISNAVRDLSFPHPKRFLPPVEMTAREHGGGSCHLERRERSLFHRTQEISPSGRNDGKRAWWRELSSRTQRDLSSSPHLMRFLPPVETTAREHGGGCCHLERRERSLLHRISRDFSRWSK